MESFPEKIMVVRHLDDVDDLRRYGRDGVLIPGQEDRAEDIAKEIYSEIKNDGKKAILFVTSPKIRARETARLVADSLRKMDNSLKIRFTAEDDLRVMDQGDFVLPDDYKQGDSHAGLKLAGKVFAKEVHASDGPDGVDNYGYKFGDPVLMPDGSFKYPELNGYFNECGESYKDVLVRLYLLIIETHEKLFKLEGKTKLVVITHGQPSQIFKDLIKVAQMIKSGEAQFTTGKLAKLCWDVYNKRDDSEKVTGRVDVLSLEELGDPKMIKILKDEIDYLNKL